MELDYDGRFSDGKWLGIEMKIKVETEKIVKTVKKLEGVEIVLENASDAKEAINLIIKKAGLMERDDYEKLKDIKVTSFQKYETSAVDYKLIFLLEFIFEDEVPAETKISIIKELQELLSKA
ncbi:MAG: hypothetical protein SVY10_05830 [Thermodesulfobacteriota bacterium]|nr:hypothetical protein [Thermodesulfobacteriota bacterium]